MKNYNGITGFYENKNEPPKVDDKQFQQLCYSMVNLYGGAVLKFKQPQVTNFYHAEMKVFNKHVHLLLNAHYPLIAFASDVTFEKIEFIDDERLDDFFKPYYQVLTIDDLNRSLMELKIALNDTEWKQIAYWKPKRFADLVFNYWD